MSDDVEEEEINVLIDFEHQVNLIRIINKTFMPSSISIKAEILPSEDTDDEDYEVAFAKIRFWFENVVSRSIAFSKFNKDALEMLVTKEGHNNTGNLLMVTPSEPTDETLAILFQAKMTALSSGKIMFGAVEVKSNNLAGLRFTFIGLAADILPSMTDWIGERTYFEEPWWYRDDASTLDVVPGEDSDLDKKPAWAYNLDFITNAIKPQDTVVLKADFKPTVIDGGKKDE